MTNRNMEFSSDMKLSDVLSVMKKEDLLKIAN